MASEAKSRYQKGRRHGNHESTSPSGSPITPHSLQALETQTKEDNLLSKNTTKAYTGYVLAGRHWLEELCSKSSTEIPHGWPLAGTPEEDPKASLDPDFAHAFDPTPNSHSPQALALYLTFKCVQEKRGRSTAEGIHAAFKNMWQSS